MLNPELTLRKLEILLAFMEKQHIGRAAESLGMSSVSVHRALHSLEEVLRCPLFSHDGPESGAIACGSDAGTLCRGAGHGDETGCGSNS